MRPALALSLVAAVVSISACGRPSYTKGARSLGASFKKLGNQVVAIAGKADVKVDVDAKGIVTDQVQRQVDRRVASIEPITLRKSVHQRQGDAGGPVQTPRRAPDVEPTIIRRDASGGSEQVWKNLYRDGERARCEKVDTFDACSATCSEHLRQESMRQLAPDAGKPEQCECTQGYSKCS